MKKNCDDDPLFIVEQPYRKDGSPNPLFNEFRMEKPALMRKLGLILENLDGFIDPQTTNFTERTGFSGDGTPAGFREDFFSQTAGILRAP